MHRAEAALLSSLDPRRLETVHDWDWLIATARDHGVLPRLERMVRNANGATPEPARRELHARARESADRSLRLTGELVRILDAFSAHGVRALAYKGPTLAVLAYGDLGVRPFRDLDIVVDPAEVDAGRALLEQLGYHTGPLDPPPEQRSGFLALNSEYPYFRANGDIVELHWRLLPCYFAMRIPFATLWERRATVDIAGHALPTLSREDLVLALCAHGSHHGWSRIEWIADVACLASAESGVDWDTVHLRARQLGGARMVAVALHLGHDLFDMEVPRAMVPLSNSPTVGWLAAWVRGRLFERAPSTDAPPELRLFHLGVHQRMRDRARYFFHFARRPGPADWALVHLPRALSPLYYLIRPLRLAWKYGRVLARWMLARP